LATKVVYPDDNYENEGLQGYTYPGVNECWKSRQVYWNLQRGLISSEVCSVAKCLRPTFIINHQSFSCPAVSEIHATLTFLQIKSLNTCLMNYALIEELSKNGLAKASSSSSHTACVSIVSNVCLMLIADVIIASRQPKLPFVMTVIITDMQALSKVVRTELTSWACALYLVGKLAACFIAIWFLVS
jgi:hypothetical protein